MKILYAIVATGSEDAIPQQLSRVDQSLEITTVVGAAEALGELRRKVSYHALMTSPALPRNEALALIATLRRDRVPVAIAPVVTDADQDFLAPAIAAGADDVLLLRGQTLVHAAETLARVRQSPHLRPADERRRLHVAYCGDDPQVWELLEMAPFVKAEQVRCAPDGSCPALGAVPGERTTPCDVVVVDERPGDAHPLQVVKTIKAQASDMPVIVLTSSAAGDIGTAALDLGADDTVIKSGIYRRRLVASLHRLHQRLEITAQHAAMRVREARMRQIVETLPEGVTSIDGAGVILAMNAAGLALVGAGRPRDVVGRPFITLVVPEQRDEVAALLERIAGGDRGDVQFDVDTTEGRRRLELRGVMLERDARGGRGVVAVLRTAAPVADGGDLERLKAELRQAREALKGAEDRRHRIEESVRAERQGRQSAEADVERLSQELSAAAALRAELESALDTARHGTQEALASFEEERAAWEQARHELEAQRSALEAARQAEREEFERASGNLERRLREAAVAGARAEVEAIREAARGDIGRMSAALGDERHRFANERDRFVADSERWAEERRSLTEALDQARHAAAEARAAAASAGIGADEEIDQLRRALDQAREAARSAEARADELERSLDGLRHEHRSQTSAIERLTSDRDFLTGRRDELERRLGEQRASAEERTVLEAALEATRIELNQALETLSRAEAERTSAREELEVTSGGHQLLSLERDLLQSEVERLNEEVARLREEQERAGQASDEERASARRLEEATAAIDGLRQQLASAEARSEAERARLEDALRHQDAERARLEDAAQALEGERGQLQDTIRAHDAERTAWDETRRDLEARLAEADAALQTQRDAQTALDAERARLEEALGHAYAERARLEDAVRAHDAERAAWHETRRDLDARLSDADVALQGQQEVQATLEAARTQLEDAVRAHDTERAAWDETRRALEARLSDADVALQGQQQVQATLESARTQLEDTLRAHEAERAAWDETRRDLEARLAEADAALQTQRDAQTALDAERARLEEALAHAHAERATLEEALRHQDAERARLEDAAQALEGERGQLQDTIRAHDTERAAWDETRRDLEARLSEADAALQTQRDAQTALDAERARLEEALGHQHAERATLEEALRNQDAERVRLQDAAHALERERGQLQDTIRAQDAERAAWEETRRDLEARLAEADEAARTQRDTRAALEADHGRLHEQIRTHEAERAELRETIRAHADDRAAWNELRLRLERELTEAREAAAALEDSRRTVEGLRDDLRHAIDALAAEREARIAERADQDERLRAAGSVWNAERERLEQTIRQLETSLRAAEDRAAEAVALEERLRRSQLEAESRIASMQSEERLARLALEARLGEASDRIVRLTEEAGSLRSGLTSALAAAEADRDRLLDSGVFGQAMMTLDGRLVRCNDAFARLLGYRGADDARSRAGEGPFAPLAGRDDLDARLLAEGSLSRAEVWLTRIDGQAIRVIESATLVPGQGGNPPLVERILIDVTTQSALETRLRQATRLEEAGRLAAAMAPEIEALLLSIADDVAGVGEGATDPVRAGMIRANAGRAGELVRQLLAFSRRQMRPTELVGLNDLVHRAEPLLARLAGPHIGFQIEAEPLPPIAANEDDVDELLTGLVVAARDLLPVGGSIRVETSVLEPADRDPDDDMADPVVRLAVTAAGYGVQVAQHTWALELAAQRCGGTLHPGGDPDHASRLVVHLPGSHAESPATRTREAARRITIDD